MERVGGGASARFSRSKARAHDRSWLARILLWLLVMDNDLSQVSSDKEHPVHFNFMAPKAHRVTLAGDFNHWSPVSMPMIRNHDGAWHLNVALRPGQHQYRFLADGVWVDDPAAKQHTPNHLGGQNAVRLVVGH